MALFSINPEIYSLNNTEGFVNIFAKILILGLPLLDMIYVILRRILERKSPFFGDKRHLHHRLMNLGFSHRNTVFIIYFLTIIGVSYSSYIVLIN